MSKTECGKVFPDTKEYFLELIEQNYKDENEFRESHGKDYEAKRKLVFIANDVFEIFTYDEDTDALFAKQMMEVITAIRQRKTFEFQDASREKYLQYLAMCHFEWLSDKLTWGTSIRGAFFDFEYFDSGMTVELPYNRSSVHCQKIMIDNRTDGDRDNTPWMLYIDALGDFLKEEMEAFDKPKAQA